MQAGPDGRKRRVSFFYGPGSSEYYSNEGHLTMPHRVRVAHTLIRSYRLHRYMEISRPNLAAVSDFVKFHSPEYVDFLASITPEYIELLDSGTAETINDPSLERFNLDVNGECPVFLGLLDYCRAYAGGSISAAVKLNRGDADIAINWAGGMHRAGKDRASGFGYVNDIVLGILELLKVFKRVLYVDIGFHHGRVVEEAFYDTDRVMTVSFHKSWGRPKTGDITDFGVGKGEYYSLNAPLKPGINDASFLELFEPVINKVMEVYQPEAVVLQCGADSLTGDELGRFNLSIKGHADCLRIVRCFNIPLMVLGGGGDNLPNVVRCWCYETAVAVGKELDNTLPINKYMDYFVPDYKLHITPHPMMNFNTYGDLLGIRNKLLTRLSQLIHAPSVQFQDTHPISQVAEVAEEDMEMRQNQRILSGSPMYDSDSDEDWCFLK